uniref:CARD domain-containing protein n=1 Tax=Phasianus colchicus TaxID=9054 RepID=A0A669PBS5_PHACC
MRLNTSILVNLNSQGVINSEEEEEVQAQNTNQKKNRCLLDLVEKKGPKAQEKLFQVLQKENPLLVEDLQKLPAFHHPGDAPGPNRLCSPLLGDLQQLTVCLEPGSPEPDPVLQMWPHSAEQT